jgi:hypothetical protein
MLKKRFYCKRCQGDGLVLVTSSIIFIEMRKDLCTSQVEKEIPPRKEEKVTIEGHLQGLGKGHN